MYITVDIFLAAPYYTSVLYYVLANKPKGEGENAERIFQVIFFFGKLHSTFIITSCFSVTLKERLFVPGSQIMIRIKNRTHWVVTVSS